MPKIIDDIDLLANMHNYSKAFVKVPNLVSNQFQSCGYEKEASIPCFYHGELSGIFLSKYYMENRKHDKHAQEIAETIARAMSTGMNITFACCGYNYAGTLVNNTNISGSIESMNVWYKNI